MAKKVVLINKHEDCYYVVRDYSNLSLRTGEPIMGSCKHCDHMFLLSEKTSCKLFKNKNGK